MPQTAGRGKLLKTLRGNWRPGASVPRVNQPTVVVGMVAAARGRASGKRSQKARPLTVIAQVGAKRVNELFLA